MINSGLSYLIGIALLIIFIVISILKKTKTQKIVFGAIFIIYITVVTSITMFPVVYTEEVFMGGDLWYNIMPFNTILSYFENGVNTTSIVQLMGNICIAIPYGFSVMLLCKNKKVWKLLLLAPLFSICIELSQLIIGLSINNMYRLVDIDDIILNTVGALVGYGIYLIIPRKITKIFKR